MNIGRVHHMGMIVPDLDRAIGGFRDVLGLELDHTEPYGDELEIAFLPCGETLVELIRPLTEEGFSADWLASAGPGIQHVAFEVDDLDAALGELADKGVRPTGAAPRPGAGNTIIAFLDPSCSAGSSSSSSSHGERPADRRARRGRAPSPYGSPRQAQRRDRELAEALFEALRGGRSGRGPRQHRARGVLRGPGPFAGGGGARGRERPPLRAVRTDAYVPRSDRRRDRRPGDRRRRAARDRVRPPGRRPDRPIRFAGPGHGLAVGAWGLGSLVGRGRAIDLCLSMREVSADEAAAIGLVDRVADDPDAAALELATQVTRLDVPPSRGSSGSSLRMASSSPSVASGGRTRWRGRGRSRRARSPFPRATMPDPLADEAIARAARAAWRAHLGRDADDELLRGLGSGSLAAAFHATAGARGDAPALAIDGAGGTHGELDDRAARVAGWLRTRGVEPGDRVLLCAPNSLALVVAYLATLRVGAVAVPRRRVAHRVRARRDRRLGRTGRRVRRRSRARRAPNARRRRHAGGGVGRRLGSDPRRGRGDGRGDRTRRRPGIGDGAAGIHLGDHGPTQRRAALAREPVVVDPVGDARLALDRRRRARPRPPALAPARARRRARDPARRLERGDPRRLRCGPAREAVAAERATVLFAVPAIYRRLVGAEGIGGSAFASLRLAISGSAPLSPALFERAGELLGREPLERYGTTESGLDTSNPYEGDRRPGSVGLPLPGVSMAIANPDGMPLEPGSDGEIVFRGPQVFAGYTDDAETAAAFHPGGWFRTGDIGRVDPATGPSRSPAGPRRSSSPAASTSTRARWSSRSRPTRG